MRLTAHIRYTGGALLLPAQDPYDREVVLEEAAFCARRHGAVVMQLGTTQVRISRIDESVGCGGCAEPIAVLNFVVDGEPLCARCARHRLHCAAANERDGAAGRGAGSDSAGRRRPSRRMRRVGAASLLRRALGDGRLA